MAAKPLDVGVGVGVGVGGIVVLRRVEVNRYAGWKGLTTTRTRMFAIEVTTQRIDQKYRREVAWRP
ncbi:MAG: hypothetical protein SYR96_20975 [Actinomycetota bacterium]|nr:hypothetical protein [Actinomycetota bacterium]